MQLGRIAPIGMAAALAIALSAVPAQADYSTTVDEGWAPDKTVYAIARHGDRIYIGGGFTYLRHSTTRVRVERAGLAAIDASTGELDKVFDATVVGRVRALAVSPDGSRLFVGGDFETLNGAPASRLAALDATTGDTLTDWEAPANAAVRDLVATTDGLYVGGKFGRLHGRPRRGLARVALATGALDNTWVANTGDGKVFSLALSHDGTQLIAGGNFLSVSGLPRELLASVSLRDGAVSDWDPTAVCLSCTVFDLDVDAAAVYGAVGGGGGGRGASWDPVTGDRNWIRRGDGDAQAVGVHEGTVYVGGHFGPVFDGQARSQLAAIKADTGTVLPYAIPFTGLAKPGVWAILAEPDGLYVGGGFRGIEGTRVRRYGVFGYVAPSTP